MDEQKHCRSCKYWGLIWGIGIPSTFKGQLNLCCLPRFTNPILITEAADTCKWYELKTDHEPYYTNFCPVCGEHYPYHHSGVEHDFKSELMQLYHAKMPLPKDNPVVRELLRKEAIRKQEDDRLVASADLAYLTEMEWSMGHHQCPVCCGCEPGVPRSFNMYDMSADPNDDEVTHEVIEDDGPRGHRSGCRLEARIKELMAATPQGKD